MSDRAPTKLDAWLRPRTSVVIAVVVAVTWLVVGIASPDTMTWLRVNPTTRTMIEGPIDGLENIMLVACIALWTAIAKRTGHDRAHRVLSVLMIVQLLLLLGEETDWGLTLGLRAPARHRNLRMYLRSIGVLQAWDDALFPTAVIIVFFLVPILPGALARRWLARAAPLRAERIDGIAVFALVPAWAVVSALIGQPQLLELVQFGAYAILLLVTVRILRATRPATPAAVA